MILQILDLAERDLVEGYRFYETKESGLGEYFLLNLYADIESLKVSAGVHRKTHLGLFRALSKRFPFAIYDSVDGELVRIRAIVDCRRDPLWIWRHLRKA